MKHQYALAALWLCLATFAAHANGPGASWVYVGTRGVPRANDTNLEEAAPQGIYAARLDAKTGALEPLGVQAELVRASWLVTHPTLPVIYSVARDPAGEQHDVNVHSFTIDVATGRLAQLNRVSSGARGTTHLALDPTTNTLFTAGFESGEVTALPIGADGKVAAVASSQKNFGTGPHRRQDGPHPHGVAVDPTHRYVLSTDLGADRVFVYRFDAKTRALARAAPPFEQLPTGSGPRHLAFHPNGKFLYVNTELTAELRTYGWDAGRGRLQLVETISSYPAGYAGNDKSSAEIAFSQDGRFLYVCLRGDQNALVVFEADAKTGRLVEIQRLGSQGKRPWSFGIDPSGRWLLVANEASGTVNVFSVDTGSGKLTPTTHSLAVPNPATVVFHRP